MGLRNRNIDHLAAIAAHKIDLSYADNAAFLAAIGDGRGPQPGDIYYDEALEALRRRTASGYDTLATPGGAAGLTLNDAYNGGQTITRDGSGTVGISDATADAVASLTLTRTAGTGPSLQITNSGTGVDVNGTSGLWSVSRIGAGVFSRLSLADGEQVRWGTGNDVTASYDGASNELRFSDAVADTGQVVFGGADGTGVDVRFRGDTAGAFVLWDQSVDDLIFDGAARLLLGDNNALIIGDGEDVSILWDATRLVLSTAAADSEIRLGDGTTRTDVRVYGSTSATSALFDASANIIEVNGYDIRLQDEDYALFGDSSDVTMRWNAANSRFHVEVAADDTEIRVGDGTLSADLRWYGATAAAFLLFDASANQLTLQNVDLVLGGTSGFTYADAVALTFGSGSDATIQWDGAAFRLDVSAADSEIRLGSSTLRADLVLYGGTSDTVRFDASASRAIFDGYDIRLQDSDILTFGDADDVSVTWNGTNLVIDPATDDTGAINIGVTGVTGMDVRWFSATGTNSALLDAGNSRLDLNGVDLRLQDSDILQFGDASDVSITWNGTNLVIDPATDDTGAINIGVTAARGMDLRWFSATGAGSVLFDAGNAVIVTSGVDLTITEADIINLGATTPITVTPAAGAVTIAAGAANDIINFGEGTLNLDLRWYGAAATNTVLFDASANDITIDDVDIHLGDNDRIQFGDAASGDITVGWDAANLTVLWAVDDTGGIVLGASAGASGDVTWFAGTASVLLDRGNALVTIDGIDLELNDDDELRLGDSDDVVIRWQAAGGLLVTGAAADSTLEFGASGVGNQFDILVHFAGGDLSSDASGDVVALDGIDLRIEDADVVLFGDAGAGVSVGFVAAAAELQYRAIAGTPVMDLDGVSLHLNDADVLSFGDALDLTIRWNGTDLVIAPVVTDTGVLRIGNNTVAPNHLNMDVAWNGGVSNTDTVILDAGASQVILNNVDLLLGDADFLRFGDATGGDINVNWDASNLVFAWAADDTGGISFGASGGSSGDVTWFSGTAEARFNHGDVRLDLNGMDLRLQDGDILQFGDAAGGDVSITWNATNLVIDPAVDDTGAINIGVTGLRGMDLQWFTAVGAASVLFDAGNALVDANGVDFRVQDGDFVLFGDASDITVTWNGTQLVVDGAADDFPIYIGDGTTNADLRIYGSAVGNYISFNNDGGTGATGLLDLTTNIMLAIFSNAPASATAAGVAGEITWDANYLYICVATNQWQRAATSTW